MSNDPLTELRFWDQVTTDAQRTVICPPDLESRIKGWVDARMMAGLITVKPSAFCPDNQILVIDEHAQAAAMADAIQNSRRAWFR